MKFVKNASMTVRLLVVTAALALLLGAYVKQQAPSIMTIATKNFINSLEPWQKTAVTFKMEDEERANWFYTPVPRKGLALHDMKPYQRQLAMAMLAAGLSQRGFIKATTIMSLDEILLVVEPTPRRDPDNYYISIFGEPSETGEWGYRFEGHHVSQNFTLVNGKVQGAPSFFGSNPAEVLDGPRKGLRVLASEEDLALEVVNSLTADQRKVAIFDAKAPADIVTTNTREAALKGQATGISASAMTPAQRTKLQDLLDEYCSNMPDEIAALRQAQIKKAGTNIWFAWAGGTERLQPNYYRVQTADFLVEFDKTQSNGNHVHSVWRDFANDFGRDLLKEHYAASHAPAK
jgi:Protein of unknown function (DUF3500)